MNQTPGNKTIFKVYFNEEIHRVNLSDVNYSSLLETTRLLFPSFNQLRHQLKYVDEEGELISICSDVELDDALQQYKNKPLKLYVASKDKPLSLEQLSSSSPIASEILGESSALVASSTVQPSQSELADTEDLTALEEVQKQVAGEVQTLNESFQSVRDEELKKNFLKPLIDELFKALFVVTKTLKEMFEKKWISMKEFMEARVAFFHEEMRKFKLKVRQLFDKLKGSEQDVENLKNDPEMKAVSCLDLAPVPETVSMESPVAVVLTEQEVNPQSETPLTTDAVSEEPKIETSPAPLPTTPTPVNQVDSLVQQLVDMGFSNKQLNAQLIEKHKGDLLLVINDLLV